MPKALHPRDDIDSLCQEKKEEEDLPAFQIAQMYRYNDSDTTYTRSEEDWLLATETIQTTQASTEENSQKTRTVRNNNYMDNSRNKQAKYHMRILKHG